jgi:hypothetical protein
MVRNLSAVNGAAPLPGRVCRNSTGAPIRQRTAAATASATGASAVAEGLAIAR